MPRRRGVRARPVVSRTGGAGCGEAAGKCARGSSVRARALHEEWRAREKLRAILDTAVDAIVSIDGRGIIQSANPATERMFGYDAGELIGQNVGILMTPAQAREHDAHLERYRRTGERHVIGIGCETQARRKDGSVFAVDLAVSEVEPGVLFTGIIRDVSERKVTEAKLREADRLASIGTLAAGLGHDMNNVLLPVRARLSALGAEGREGRLSPGAREDVAEITRSIEYLQQLADGLHFLVMDPDKGASGVTDLAAWWSQTGKLLSRAVPRHVRVTSVIREDLPSVTVSAHSLTQAVLNLIVNAGESIPAGRKRRQGLVRVGAEIVGEGGGTSRGVRLSVTDNGCGMTEEVRRRACDMFFTTKTRGLGTGLGLALVRRVAERAGGRIDIESSLGHGTTVSMTLPTTGEAGPATVCAAISIGDGRGAAMVRHVLESDGFRVEGGGEAAGAEMWVVDAVTPLAKVREWRKAHPGGRLVMFGKPGRRDGLAWAKLGAIVIEDRDDLEAIRDGLGRARA